MQTQLLSGIVAPAPAKYFTTQAEKFKSELTTKFTNHNSLPQSVTTYKPAIFHSMYQADLLLQQQRKRNERVFLEQGDYSNLAKAIAAVAAILIGTLIFYAFVNESEQESVVGSRVRQSLVYLASGLGVTAVAARSFFNSPFFWRFATMNPWISLGLTLGGTIASMIATTAIPYENTIPKHLAFVAFNSMVGLSICPLVSLGTPLLLKAAFATGCVVSTLALTAAAAPEGTFLSWGGPLSIGLGTVFAASIGSLVFPGSTLLYNVVLYGGAGIFGLFVLHDVDKMKVQAKYSQSYDPINNTISLYLDIINLFVRIAQMMSNSKSR